MRFACFHRLQRVEPVLSKAMNDEFVPSPIFCCIGFQHLVTAAGQRGIAALVAKSTAGISFRLQARGIAFEDEEKLGPMPGSPDIKIHISSESGLQYCPICGQRLDDLVTMNPKAFAELAEEHQKLHTFPCL